MSETSETNNTAAEQDKRQRVLAGKVVSNAMDKTIVVLIERRTQHPLYGKYIRRSTRLKAHDPENTCQVGDFVEIADRAEPGEILVSERTMDTSGNRPTDSQVSG